MNGDSRGIGNCTGGGDMGGGDGHAKRNCDGICGSGGAARFPKSVARDLAAGGAVG